MTDDTLWRMGACDLARRIAAGDLSAREAVDAAVSRMRARNPHVNAVTNDLGEAAMADAAVLDETFARSGPVGPLHGVPVTIKDNVDQEGLPNPNGVAAFRDLIAPADAPVVRNLKAAGAVVIGRTNTPEFSFRVDTDNPLFGRTLNPWDAATSPGGSSGGASSAVMSGMGALAHGNDIAGSLRYPASVAGAATVKPGLGRVPAYNPSAGGEKGLLAQLMAVQGLIAREVRDVRLGMKALIAYDARDPWMVPMPFDGPAPDRPVRIAFTRETFEFDLHPAVDDALRTARDALTDAGYEVVEVEPPLVREIADEAMRALFGEMKLLVADDIRRHGSTTINAVFDDYFTVFRPHGPEELLRAMGNRSRYVREWLLFLEEYPLVLTPYMPAPTCGAGRDTEGPEGVRDALGRGIHNYAMNFLGLPAGNVAAGMHDNLPVGVQIVGRRFREDMILDACEAVESRVGVMAHRLFERG